MSPPYGLVGLCSLTTLAFEIALIRIFSVRFNYHYAALVISISMIGLVAGGLFTYMKGRSRQREPGSAATLAVPAAWALSLSYPATLIISFLMPFDHVRLLWEDIQLLYLLLDTGFFALPFFFYGVILSSLMKGFAASVHRIYASDLIGAACGITAVIIAADHMQSELIVAGLPLIPAAYLLFQAGSVRLKAACAALLVILCVPVFSGVVSLPLSPYKGLMQALNDDGARLVTTIHSAHSRLDLFENPRMRFAPGLSLAYTGPVPRGLGVALDGDVAGVIGGEADPVDTGFYDHLPQSIPLKVFRPECVLLIGFRSSLSLLMPYHFGATSVIVAEEDRSIARLLQHHYSPSSLHGKSLRRATGRGFLEETGFRPDLIVLSRLGFFPSGTFGLQEDYDLTIEALTLYLKALSDDGALFIEAFLLPPPRQELRLMNVVIAALRKLGIADARQHVIVFRTWDTIAFVVKEKTFSAGEVEQAASLMRENQFDLLYPARIAGLEPFITGFDYTTLFSRLASVQSAREFTGSYTFDISAVTDDRPFFHYFLKLRNVPVIYAMAGRKWPYFVQEGMAIPFVATLLFVLVAALFSVLAVFRRGPSKVGIKETMAGRRASAMLSAYFLAIAVAFMFLEVSFIHALLLPLGAPMTAFGVAVGVLLVSAGAGSLLGSRLPGRYSTIIMGMLPLLALACLTLRGVSSPNAIVAMIALAGIPMGFFLPAGVRLLEEGGRAGLVPYVYAVNGTGSIVAPVVASMMAVALGFTGLIVCSSLLYGLSLLLLHLARHRYKNDAA